MYCQNNVAFFGTLSQTLDLEKFRHLTSTIAKHYQQSTADDRGLFSVQLCVSRDGRDRMMQRAAYIFLQYTCLAWPGFVRPSVRQLCAVHDMCFLLP